MSWRVVKSTGGAFWLARGDGASILFGGPTEAQGALEELAAHLGWQLSPPELERPAELEPLPTNRKGARRG